MEQATGLEKKEIDALMAGVEVGSLFVQQCVQQLLQEYQHLIHGVFSCAGSIQHGCERWPLGDKGQTTPRALHV